jgi:HAL2 family 3'(2'),5'-bisphosphate nucleotidase
MFKFDSPEVIFAINAVNQASALARHIQVDMVTPALTKDDRSPVTVADFASQALVGHMIDEIFPGDPLVGEEDATALRQSNQIDLREQVTHFVAEVIPQASSESVCTWIDRGNGDPGKRFWTLDPIDGTKGFLRGDQYAIALALIIDGQVQIGVLGCPNLVDGHRLDATGSGTIAVAIRNQGSWISSLYPSAQGFNRVYVSNHSTLHSARLLRSFESGHTNVSQIDLLVQSMDIQVDPIRMDSQAKYIVLAVGQGELYLRMLSPNQPDYREKIWDQAAGSILIQEAGGTVTDLDGAPLDFSAGKLLINNRGVCASNGSLHTAALQGIKAIQA